MRKHTHTVGLMVFMLAIATIGLAWEGLWWQELIDIYSIFGDPPQLVYHTALVVMLFISLKEGRRSHTKEWSAMSTFLVLLLLNIPLTYYVNKIGGAPSRSGLVIYWGAPYIFTSIFAIAIGIELLAILRKKTYAPLLSYTVYACMLIHLLIRLRPLRPTSTVYDLIGFWGPGVIIAIVLLILLHAKNNVQSSYVATKTTALTFVIYGVIGLLGIATFAIAEQSAAIWQHMLFGKFTHPPTLLSSTSFLLCAFILDLRVCTLRTRTVLAAIAQSGLLYGTTHRFLVPVASFGIVEYSTAVFSASLGGLMAYYLFLLSTKQSRISPSYDDPRKKTVGSPHN